MVVKAALALFSALALAGCGAVPYPGRHALYFHGEIDDSAYHALRLKIDASTVLVVDSGGGPLNAAVDLAQEVALMGAAVRVEGTCASSCVLVLLGAQERSMAPGSRIGVHRPSGTDSEGARVKLARLYTTLGVPRGIVRAMSETPNTSIHWLTPGELAALGVEVRP